MRGPLTARAALLLALRSGPGYGIELVRRVGSLLGGKARIGLGSLYPALGSLERDGLVVSRKVVPARRRGGRSRIYYDLTPRGEEAAAEQRSLLIGALRGCASEPARPDAVERMRERLRAGARLSEFGLELRRRRLAHGGRL